MNDVKKTEIVSIYILIQFLGKGQRLIKTLTVRRNTIIHFSAFVDKV